jgi:hypothetical protein
VERKGKLFEGMEVDEKGAWDFCLGFGCSVNVLSRYLNVIMEQPDVICSHKFLLSENVDFRSCCLNSKPGSLRKNTLEILHYRVCHLMMTIGACIVTDKVESYFQSKEQKRREVFSSKIQWF